MSLYATQDEPTPQWVESQTVTVDSTGRYSVQFGAMRPEGLPAELFAEGAARWVGVAVDAAPEGPRMMLLSVAYATKAAYADSLGGRTAVDFVLAENLGGAVRAALGRAAGSSTSTSDPPTMGAAALDGGGTLNTIVKFLNGAGTIGDSAIAEVSGKVGIGTVSPATKLHLYGSAYARFESSSGTSDLWDIGIDDVSQRIRFINSTSGAGEVVSILRGGNVGIGTVTPAAKLHLYGSAYARLQSSSGTSDLWDVGIDDTTQRIRFINSTSGVGEVVSILRGGNVGIGITAPAARFHVAGDIKVDGNISAKFQDVAEWVDSVEALEAGTLVVIDRAGKNRVLASARAYDSRVAGAISAQPGVVLGEGGPGRELVAQSGRVRIKADARYGAIRPGDLLSSSPTKGHAMRSRPVKAGDQWLHRPGTLIGKALEALPSGRGEILVLLTLQ